MPDNIETTLHASIQRVMNDMMDNIAQDGLTALKSVLDESGASEKLKQYELLSHISGDEVLFEIIVDTSVVIATDPKTVNAIKTVMSVQRQKMMEKITKSFEIGESGPRRTLRDVRSPSRDARRPSHDARRDARRPSRDARKPSSDARRKSSDNEFIDTPHGMEMKGGKLSITLERSVRKTASSEFKVPEGPFQGLLADFMTRLNDSIANNFSEKLQAIINSHV